MLDSGNFTACDLHRAKRCSKHFAMSGAKKFYEKFQLTLKHNSQGGMIQEINFPEKNETKKFQRSKSGRFKLPKWNRPPITDSTFSPVEDGAVVTQNEHNRTAIERDDCTSSETYKKGNPTCRVTQI